MAVTLVALAGGGFAWAALFNAHREQPANAPAQVVADARPTTAIAPEPPPAATNEPVATGDAPPPPSEAPETVATTETTPPPPSDTTAPATVDAAPPAATTTAPTPPIAAETKPSLATADTPAPSIAAETKAPLATTTTPQPPAAETKRQIAMSETTMPATATETKPARASIRPTPRALVETRESAREKSRRWTAPEKSRRAIASRRARFTLAATGDDREPKRLRWLHVRARPRTQVAVIQTHTRGDDDPLDGAYSAGPTVVAQAPIVPASPPRQVALSSASEQSEPAVAPKACVRVFHAFGATRRVPSDC